MMTELRITLSLVPTLLYMYCSNAMMPLLNLSEYVFFCASGSFAFEYCSTASMTYNPGILYAAGALCTNCSIE